MQPVANTTSVATGMDDPADSFHEYDNKIAQIARSGYPEMARLRQVTGVGELIALTYVLTLEDPQRFRRNRDVGGYLGLRPKRRDSGASRPPLRITKEGDVYLRMLLFRRSLDILVLMFGTRHSQCRQAGQRRDNQIHSRRSDCRRRRRRGALCCRTAI